MPINVLYIEGAGVKDIVMSHFSEEEVLKFVGSSWDEINEARADRAADSGIATAEDIDSTITLYNITITYFDFDGAAVFFVSNFEVPG